MVMDVFIDCGNYVTMCIYIYNLKIYMYIYTIKISYCIPLKNVIQRKYIPFFILFFLNCTILYWFCHISKWIRHRHTCVPHPEPSSLLPPHTIPLGRPSVPAPSIQYCALNLDWRLVSYMILYNTYHFCQYTSVKLKKHNIIYSCSK